MNSTWIAAIVVITIISVLSAFYVKQEQEKISDQLTKMLLNKQYAEFDKMVESSKVKRYIEPFNLDFLKLNAAMMLDNAQQVHHQFDYILSKSLTEKQLYSVCIRTMDWCIANDDKKYCGKCLNQINRLKGYEKTKELTAVIYRVVIEQKSTDLNDLLNKADQLPNQQRVIYEYLISMIYEQLGNKEASKKYCELALKDTSSQQDR